MPTGYTACLEEMGFNVAKWLRTVAPRAMGMCVMLREDPFSLTEAEILARLERANGSYYRDGIARAESQLAEWKAWGRDEWEAARVAANTKAAQAHREQVAADRIKAAGYNAASAQVQKLLAAATAEIDINTLKFALQQILTSKQDERFEPGAPALVADWQAYRDETTAKTAADLAYHHKHLAEDSGRDRERLAAYKGWLAFLDANGAVP